MGKKVGIDIGGSTTKIVGYDSGQIFSPFLVKANDPIASLYGAFGKFLNDNKLEPSDIENVMITGVGSSFVAKGIYGIPTGRVDEFRAIGTGGLFLSGLKNAVIVSMGTGTALIKADEKGIRHLGGTGIGGGTLVGLSNSMLNIRSFDTFVETARDGNLANVDLSISDITKDMLAGLPPETTASNFGKISDLASKPDMALGILNLVFQVIGTMSYFASRIDGTNDIVLTGSLANIPYAHESYKQLSQLYGVNYHIPAHAEYATAAGAAIAFTKGMPYTNIV